MGLQIWALAASQTKEGCVLLALLSSELSGFPMLFMSKVIIKTPLQKNKLFCFLEHCERSNLQESIHNPQDIILSKGEQEKTWETPGTDLKAEPTREAL